MLNEKIYPHFISDSPKGIDCFEEHTQEQLAANICKYIKSIDSEPDKKLGGNIPRIIGIEGGWGSGKSNVVSMIDNEMSENSYYTFTYDAWGHQEDLQRRSILETLTNDLIDNNVLRGKVSIRMRNGKDNYADWRDQLSLLLPNKSTTIRKSIPRLSSASVCGILLIALYGILNAITGRLMNDCTITLWIALCINLIPILIGTALILYRRYRDKNWEWALKLISQKEDSKIDEEFSSSEEPSVNEFKNWLDSLSDYFSKTKLSKKKLIVVFDNMDRLPSKKVMQLWSSIYTFFAGGNYENIWVIIPYDYQHLCQAISIGGTNEGANKDRMKRFIDKTFPITYNIPQPVVTDYEKLFNTYFEQAFGKGEKDQRHICLVFMEIHPIANPRTVISFVNELVAMRLQWPDEDGIRLQIIALFILKKEKILYNGKSLEENLLGDEIFEGIASLYPETEDIRAKLCQLAYGIHAIEKAAELPMLRTLRVKIGKGDSILELSNHTNFVSILEKVLSNENMIKQHIDEAIQSLKSLDSVNFNDEEKMTIKKKWDFLANIMCRTQLDKPTFDSSHHELLLHCSKKRLESVAAHLCNELQQHENRGKEYYQALTELEATLSDVHSTLDIQTLLKAKDVSSKEFQSYVLCAKENYPKYKLRTSNDELNTLLLEQAQEGNNDSAVTMKYLKSDKYYSFEHLFENIQNNIQQKKITTEIFASAYISRILTQPGEKVATKFDQSVINTCLSLEDACRKVGYEDVVAMSLANGADVSNFREDKLLYLSECIEYYMEYSNLIKHLGSNGSAYRLLNEYMLLHHLGTSVPYDYIAQNITTIKDQLGIEYTDIIQRLDECQTLDWTDPTSGSNALFKSNLTNYLPLNMMQVYKDNWGNFSQSLVELGISALIDKPVGFLFNLSYDSIDEYWKTFVETFLDANVTEDARKVLTKELTYALNDIKQNARPTIEGSNVLHLLISESDKTLLPEFLRTELNSFFFIQDCRHDAFILFGKMLPMLGADMDTNTASGLITHFVKPNYDKADSVSIIIENKQFYIDILKKDISVSLPIIKGMLAKSEYSEIHGELSLLVPKEADKSE